MTFRFVTDKFIRELELLKSGLLQLLNAPEGDEEKKVASAMVLEFDSSDDETVLDEEKKVEYLDDEEEYFLEFDSTERKTAREKEKLELYFTERKTVREEEKLEFDSTEDETPPHAVRMLDQILILINVIIRMNDNQDYWSKSKIRELANQARWIDNETNTHTPSVFNQLSYDIAEHFQGFLERINDISIFDDIGEMLGWVIDDEAVKSLITTSLAQTKLNIKLYDNFRQHKKFSDKSPKVFTKINNKLSKIVVEVNTKLQNSDVTSEELQEYYEREIVTLWLDATSKLPWLRLGSPDESINRPNPIIYGNVSSEGANSLFAISVYIDYRVKCLNLMLREKKYPSLRGLADLLLEGDGDANKVVEKNLSFDTAIYSYIEQLRKYSNGEMDAQKDSRKPAGFKQELCATLMATLRMLTTDESTGLKLALIATTSITDVQRILQKLIAPLLRDISEELSVRSIAAVNLLVNCSKENQRLCEEKSWLLHPYQPGKLAVLLSSQIPVFLDYFFSCDVSSSTAFWKTRTLAQPEEDIEEVKEEEEEEEGEERGNGLLLGGGGL